MEFVASGRVAAVSFVAEAVDGLVGLDEYVAAPADILAVDRPAAVLAHSRYVLACNLDFSQTAANVKSLALC